MLWGGYEDVRRSKWTCETGQAANKCQRLPKGEQAEIVEETTLTSLSTVARPRRPLLSRQLFPWGSAERSKYQFAVSLKGKYALQ